MCGIAGYISPKNKINDEFIAKAKKSLEHRGPDENGHYASDKICLINTRLSIIDIKEGQQPFISKDEMFVVVQNGEIYNFLEVKEMLSSKHAVKFNTNSDTEVILKAYEILGTDCFSYFNGMFAIAIFDKKKQKVILGRDRIGVKPLFTTILDGTLFFSSEIKTFLDIENFDKEVCAQSIHNYFKFNYIPIPQTIFKSVMHVKPGTFLEISTTNLSIKETRYWEIANTSESEYSENDVIERIDTVLNSAIDIRLRSDVDIAAFLSGGLDSSLVCAMTKQNFNVNLNTFSIGFPEKRFDESTWAQKVAKLNHLSNQTRVLDEDIISMWEKTTWFNDQPHGDISFIPTFYLSQFASEEYKVVFTGDGGDEFCAGYEKYFSLFESKNIGEYFNNISLVKDDKIFNKLYTSDFFDDISLDEPKNIFENCINEISKKDDINKILYFDVKHLLPGNNLVKPDKMAMANSLETRSPMLDYRFLELMQDIKGSMKLKQGDTKHILKKFAKKYLPEDVIYRKKQMFTVPVGEWFKDKLRDYLTEIICSESLASRKIFNTEYLKEILDLHISGNKDFTRELRAIVNLEIWFRLYVDEKS